MHRIPKIFGHSSNSQKHDMDSGSGNGSRSSRPAAKPKARLDRRNAKKNINYEYSPNSTSASLSSLRYSSDESLRTRSLELYCDKTSFRIDGVDGEIETLFKNLGFSGIDDFSIAPEEYEAMKLRSSSAPVEFSQIIDEVDYGNDVDISGVGVGDLLNQEIEGNSSFVRYLDHRAEVIDRKSGKIHDYCDADRRRGNAFGSSLMDSVRVSDVIFSDNVSGRSHESRGNGIKGVRPPVLAPPPLVFGPGCDISNSRSERQISLDEDEEGDQNKSREADQEDARRKETVSGENYVHSGSYSFTTNSNDDDCSSTTTDPMSSISPNGINRRVIKAWQKGGILGRGSFGSVYEGIADDGFFFAVKEVSLLDQGDEGKQRIIQLEQEIALLHQFQHENIVQYYGTAKDESHLYIFLELVSQGSLFSLHQKYILRDSVVSGYTRQILHGLNYLHNRNVVHRDIKCANILVDTNGSVKLADFGLAKAVKLNDVKSCKGTAFWMAPEVVRSQGYGLAADIWSLGCTVLEMLTGRVPYSNLECMPALFKIGRGERPPIPDSLSSDARDFILKCLQIDSSMRPTAAQLLDHPFVKRPLPSSLGFTSPHNFARQI